MKALVVALAAVLAFPVPVQAQRGFAPLSTSWTTQSRGWVLGVDGEHPVLLHTIDGGATWQRTAVPDVGANRLRVFFANDSAGMLTNGRRLFVTRSGGASWQEVDFLTPQRPAIGALGADSGELHAVVATPSLTRLYSAPLGQGPFQPVPGVTLSGAVEGDLAESNLVLARAHEEVRYWAKGPYGWQERKPPCDAASSTRLSTAENVVFALCGWDPGMGFMHKELFAATPDGSFLSVGRGPEEGISIDLAAASASVVTVSAPGRMYRAVGATWSTSLVRAGGPFLDLHFTDAFNGFMVRECVYRTSDAGASWQKVPMAD